MEPTGLLADENLPADAGTLGYRLRVSDFFGRFGQAEEATLDASERPSPPPVIRYELEIQRSRMPFLSRSVARAAASGA